MMAARSFRAAGRHEMCSGSCTLHTLACLDSSDAFAHPGQQFLPQAIQLLEDSERLFTPGKKQQAEAVAGLVRVTVPDLPDEDTFLLTLLERLQP